MQHRLGSPRTESVTSNLDRPPAPIGFGQCHYSLRMTSSELTVRTLSSQYFDH